MNRNTGVNYGFLLIWVWALACTSQPTQDESSLSGPNIIYILVDDMGYGDLSCYGQEVLQTPHIDALAETGMRFTQHYAGSTVCAPSRASLLTGKHPGHVSVRGNYAGQLIQPEEITLAEALKVAGYTTGIIGKWGVGHPPPPDDPLRNGFDHAYGYINMWHAHNFYPEFLYRNGKREPLPGNVTDSQYPYRADMPEGTGVAKEKETYTLFEFEKDALGFLEAHQDTSFFLYLALNMPHANNEAGYFTGDGMEVPDHGAFASEAWPKPEKGFAQMITLIDQTVGNIQQKVSELGLAENTLVIFTSDNGPHQEGGHKADFFDSNGPLRGTKRDLYEGGIRVPMIASWPGTIQAGTQTNHLSAFWDVLPTFCELTGTALPAGIDGISFTPTLLGQPKRQVEHPFLYWEFYEQGGKQAIRRGPWKYVKLNVRDSEKPVIAELYRIDQDLGEAQNLVEHYPKIQAEMDSLAGISHTPFPGMSLFFWDRPREGRH